MSVEWVILQAGLSRSQVDRASLPHLGYQEFGVLRQPFPGLCSGQALPSAGASEYFTQ